MQPRGEVYTAEARTEGQYEGRDREPPGKEGAREKAAPRQDATVPRGDDAKQLAPIARKHRGFWRRS